MLLRCASPYSPAAHFRTRFDDATTVETIDNDIRETILASVINDPRVLPAESYGLLSKERTIAGPGYNRWLVPPAALAIHLCIGMAYGFSVFWLPLSKAIGGKESLACGKDTSLLTELFTTTCDWRISSLGWMYTLFFVFLGCSAAIWGGWLERVGPRKAGVVAAVCWAGGLVISAIGIKTHQLWIMWLGSGVIGGVGLGLGYISPVSTLIKWFPDRRGMATGMAIMGFGGGAMIGSPLATELMKAFATPAGPGVATTFVVMGAIYFVFMMGGAFGYRVPATGWKPSGWTPPVAAATKAMITQRPRAREKSVGHSAVLAGVAGALHERVGGHRRDRHLEPDAAGSLRGQPDRQRPAFQRAGQGAARVDRDRRRWLHRAPEPVQHRRPLLLGEPVGQARSQGHLRHLLHPRRRALREHSRVGGQRQQAAVRGRVLHHPQHVRRRVRDGARPTWPTCSARRWWARSTAVC